MSLSEDDKLKQLKLFIDGTSSYMLIHGHKIIKTHTDTYIYYDNITNENSEIYTMSPSSEMTIHTNTKYIYFPFNDMKNSYDALYYFIKNNMFLTPQYCDSYYKSYKELLNTHHTFTESKNVNENVFICCHSGLSFAHTFLYMFPLIYDYYLLKKLIPDLKLYILYCTNYVTFLLKLLNINEYVVLKTNERIINTGTTYFSNHIKLNMCKDVINNFFYDIITRKSLLLNNKITENIVSPKKIIFLRNNTNTVSDGIIQNRNDIVKIANKYGYIDIDQTKMEIYQTIKIINDASHIIMETGSSMIHLLWSLQIKSILLVSRPEIYYNTLGSLCDDVSPTHKIKSDNVFCDIAKIKKSKIIFDDYSIIKHDLNKPHVNIRPFLNIYGLIEAIEENENSDVTEYKIFK